MLGAKLGKHAGNLDGAHPLCLQVAEHDGAAHRAPDCVDGVAGCGSRRERRACLGEQRAAGVAERDLVGRAIEQARVELALEVAHSGRDRGLDDVETIGRTREAALLRHCDKHRELPEFHALRLSPNAISVSTILR